jgi:hypothetical protein
MPQNMPGGKLEYLIITKAVAMDKGADSKQNEW